MKRKKQRTVKRLRRIVYAIVERIVVGFAGLLIPHLSRCAEHRFANWIGDTMHFFGVSSRRIAAANLDIVYGTSKTSEEKRAILRASFRHAALVMLDYFWFSRDTEKRVATYCRGDNAVVDEWVTGHFPGIFVTGHIGNWELAGQYVASRGRTMWSVYRPIGTRRTLKTLLGFRVAIGQKVIPREGAMVGMLRALHAKDLVALLLDQHTEVVDGGVYHDFFSLPATFSGAAAVLAKRLAIPICIAGSIHNPETDTYAIKVYDVVPADIAAEQLPEAITARIVAGIERMILDNPSQWLWSYRRWKRYRLHDDPSRFPFYAKKDASV